MSLKALFKGWFGEFKVKLAMALFLDSKHYVRLHNVTLPTADGTTQIDHILVSRYGIFVLETKSLKGLIIGDEKSPQWTQKLFTQQFNFQNPLRQNYRHVCALADLLGITHDRFISIVIFNGDCQLQKSHLPNVISGDYIRYIKRHRKVMFTQEQVQQVVSAIKAGCLANTWQVRRQHIASLQKRLAKPPLCPQCGSKLVLRMAKTGKKAGTSFYGCSSYPQCRHISPIPKGQGKA